jgi:hypothetical protein
MQYLRDAACSEIRDAQVLAEGVDSTFTENYRSFGVGCAFSVHNLAFLRRPTSANGICGDCTDDLELETTEPGTLLIQNEIGARKSIE